MPYYLPFNSDKLIKLGESAKYDVSCSSCYKGSSAKSPLKENPQRWIYPATLPDGSIAPILKILLTNLCSGKCKYCIVSSRNTKETISFKPEELAYTFITLARKRIVRGIFLSSGMGIDTKKTMDDIIKTAEIIRNKYLYSGYIHLKILPGADLSHIESAAKFADRISINLEAPTKETLKKIAKEKDFDLIIERMKWINIILKSGKIRAKAHTTQFVVGAGDETDKEILETTLKLYKNFNLWRAYFSAFQPVPGTPLEDHPPAPLKREHRLYQADFLFRKYNFNIEEIVFDKDGNLSLEKDPKLHWALRHPEIFPVEINTASYEQLIRIPGIGPLSAKKIITLRKQNKFNSVEDLKTAGIYISRAQDFLLINGRYFRKEKQLQLIV